MGNINSDNNDSKSNGNSDNNGSKSNGNSDNNGSKSNGNSDNNDSKSNGNSDNSSLNWLPKEIMYEILTRVPAESLVRFQLVCKLWKTIIRDPKFISSHLHIWKSKPSFIFTADFEYDHMLLSDLQERDSTDFRLHIPKDYMNIVASTDGLLLLEGLPGEGCQGPLCVYNPVTGSQTLLPLDRSRRMLSDDFFLIVYDASTQKYKVLVFIESTRNFLGKINIITVDNDGDRGSLEWRTYISPSTFCLEGGFKPITVNGILHWLAFTCDVESSTLEVAFIQSMDIAKEEFRGAISLPCQPKSNFCDNLINCNLLEIEGSIYFSNPATELELELWMLEDLANHNWIKKHKICLVSIVGKPNSLSSFLVGESFYPIQMIGNLGLMIIRHDATPGQPYPDGLDPFECVVDEDIHLFGRGWYLYNLRSQELKTIASRSIEVKLCRSYSQGQITHVKSLVGWK